MATGPKITTNIQTSINTADTFGGQSKVWKTVETIRKAILIAKKGDERLVAGKDNVFSDYTLYLSGKRRNRVTRTVTESQRVLIGSRVFDIVYVDDILGMNQTLRIHLREIK